MYPEVSFDVKEFLFLEFNNGNVSIQLLHKFKFDPGFQRFVLSQFEKKVKAEKGLKSCKMPHPLEI